MSPSASANIKLKNSESSTPILKGTSYISSFNNFNHNMRRHAPAHTRSELSFMPNAGIFLLKEASNLAN
ncbi:hypothetical protein EUGRSUZ_F03365 [Eucalyptus grandis]|uniref:Uncharacterized protein n=2 Tax=Eucalyptus grandis TaxID=71139 RepID=A0ACC3KL01_EUCGR|nr:hypothetical protein EUGRSUZ_F03365 [Eucalyptus grandis]